MTLHTGDSHKLLPELLAPFAEQGRNVDFALVDGDHSAEGVQRDIEDLLNSDAVRNTLILIHDVNNEQVRRGVDAVRYRTWPGVAYVELDCVPGYMFSEERLRHELWGGLGLIVVDASRPATAAPDPMQQRYYAALRYGRRSAIRRRARGHAVARQPASWPHRERERQLEADSPRRTRSPRASGTPERRSSTRSPGRSRGRCAR